MDTWTLQAGFPVLDVKRVGNQVTFSQVISSIIIFKTLQKH